MNRGRFPQAGLASAVLTLYDKEKLTIQDARGVIRMDAVLLQRLSQITEEERELLQGRGVDRALYASGRAFEVCLLYTSPSPRDRSLSRMPSSA